MLLLLVAAGCSDDAPAADSGPAREAGAEAAPPSDGGSDGDVWTGGDAGPAPDPNMLPGCAAACGADQVCKAGACVDLPTTACGSDKWGGALGGNVLYVDAAYAQSDSNGSEQKPYQSIADALSKLPGDDYTIVVTDGTYDAGGPLLITRPVILRCRCPDKVRIASPVVVTRTASSPAAPVQVQIVGCTIAPGASAPSAAPSCGGTNNDEPRGVTVTQPQSGQPVQLSLRDETRVFGWCTGVAMIGADAADALCLSGARVTHNVRGVDASKAAASLSAALPGCTFKHGVSIEDSRIANNTDYGVFTRQGATTLGCKSSLIERNGTLAQNVKAGLG
ncbi:MAG: hypothetical protein KDH91_07690, partial [Rhodoferax sp.]|nr:hypothetical protein [Rhodoferax sp.]